MDPGEQRQGHLLEFGETWGGRMAARRVFQVASMSTSSWPDGRPMISVSLGRCLCVAAHASCGLRLDMQTRRSVRHDDQSTRRIHVPTHASVIASMLSKVSVRGRSNAILRRERSDVLGLHLCGINSFGNELLKETLLGTSALILPWSFCASCGLCWVLLWFIFGGILFKLEHLGLSFP